MSGVARVLSGMSVGQVEEAVGRWIDEVRDDDEKRRQVRDMAVRLSDKLFGLNRLNSLFWLSSGEEGRKIAEILVPEKFGSGRLYAMQIRNTGTETVRFSIDTFKMEYSPNLARKVEGKTFELSPGGKVIVYDLDAHPVVLHPQKWFVVVGGLGIDASSSLEAELLWSPLEP